MKEEHCGGKMFGIWVDDVIALEIFREDNDEGANLIYVIDPQGTEETMHLTKAQGMRLKRRIEREEPFNIITRWELHH